MEMEKPFSFQCKQLLTRVRNSNVNSFIPKSRTKADKEFRLQSLSLQRRKTNSLLKRQHSLTNGFNEFGFLKQDKLNRSNEKVGFGKENLQACQPQFNLRKNTKLQNCSKPSHQPFGNVANVNKFRLTLQKDRAPLLPLPVKPKQDIEESMKLQVNGLVHNQLNFESQDQSFPRRSTKKKSTFLAADGSYEDADNAIENANKVNEIFTFIKERSRMEGEDIDEFTQIIFKLACYFFVTLRCERGCRVVFDPHKMIEFIEREMVQSFTALNSFKKSRQQNVSMKQNEENSPEREKFVRKSHRVSSFFKSVDGAQNSEKEDSRVDSLKKFNKAMASSEEDDDDAMVISNDTNNLMAVDKNGNRRLSIPLNAVQQDNEQSQEGTSSDMTETQNLNSKQKMNEQIEQNNPPPKINYRTSMTKRNSCFLTEMNRMENKNQRSSKDLSKIRRQSVSSQNRLKFQQMSSNSNSQSQFKSESQLSSVVGLSTAKGQTISSQSKINLKEKIGSKVNLNLSTPYDFLKEDSLMTKRRKYLELHQELTSMMDNINELKKEEVQINERIELKDNELIDMESKLITINQEIQVFEARNKQAQDFLNGSECPQMVQKIIKKNIELKKNLTSLLNSHAWECSNLSQASHAQHIMITKQSSVEKLNSLTRKFRGCKELENIESLVVEMRDLFLFTGEKYSEIIDEFQDKLRQAEEERSNMLKNLEDWQIENKIKEKLLNSSFLDYYSVERKVTNYIQKLPESLKKLQQYFFIISRQAKPDCVVGPPPDTEQKPGQDQQIQEVRTFENVSKKMGMLEKEINVFLEKMFNENGVIANQLPKQKKFAMVLEKIV